MIEYDPSVVYTTEELAQRWKVRASTIYDLIRKGKLAAFKVGVGYRVTDRAVREYEEGVLAS